MDFRKFKNFCSSKVSISKMKRQANHGLGENSYKIHLLKDRQTEYVKNIRNSVRKQPNIKHVLRSKQTLHQRGTVQLGSKYMKRCSTSLVIRKMWIKTTMKYHYTSITITQIKINWPYQMLVRGVMRGGRAGEMGDISNTINNKKYIFNKCWWEYGVTGTLTHCWWDCKMVQSLWKSIRQVFL